MDPPPLVRGALFDVGYCLMDESARLDHALRWLCDARPSLGGPLDLPRLHAAYEEACRAPAPGEPSLLVQMLLALGVPPDRVRTLRTSLPWDAVPLDPYPDAGPALRRLGQAGFRVGVLANQPPSAAADLDRAGLAPLCDGVWLSGAVGRQKPDPAFFALALDAWGLPPARVAYVGDRPDNDVAPARRLGLATVRVRRGPHAGQAPRQPDEWPDAEVASLDQAVSWLLGWQARPSGAR